jgi:hypothetical protein
MIFFFKSDQLDFPKMGQVLYLIRWCNLIGFSCMGEGFILRNQIWKTGLPGERSTEN